MITAFTANVDFKRVIEEQQIRPSRIKAFLKEQGILLLNSNASDLANSAYTLFLGSNDMELLQNFLLTEKNYQKSTMLFLEPANQKQSQDEFITELLDELNRFKHIGEKYWLEDIYNYKDGSIHLKFKFEKHINGKMSFISKKKKILDINIEKVPKSKKLKLDIRQQDSTDSKEVLSFIENIQNNGTKNIFTINHITLDYLSKQNKIEFFDLLAKNKFKDWKLDTITGISVSKNEDEEDESQEFDEETDQSGTLAGISSAVLRGNSLRTNEFVQMCLRQGFLIMAMKYKYVHMLEAKSVIIDVNFKNKDIRIDIDKTYLKEDDGSDYVTPLPFSEQDEIIKLFQDASNNIYKRLLESQKSKAV